MDSWCEITLCVARSRQRGAKLKTKGLHPKGWPGQRQMENRGTKKGRDLSSGGPFYEESMKDRRKAPIGHLINRTPEQGKEWRSLVLSIQRSLKGGTDLHTVEGSSPSIRIRRCRWKEKVLHFQKPTVDGFQPLRDCPTFSFEVVIQPLRNPRSKQRFARRRLIYPSQ